MWKYVYKLNRTPQPATTPRIRKSMRNRWRSMAERRSLQGLTTRGSGPKRRLEHRLLLAEVDALAGSITAIFNELPATVQAHALNLERSLSAFRKKIT